MLEDDKILKREGLGILITFVAVNLVIIFNATPLQIYNPSTIFIGTIVFSTFYGSIRSGFLSAAMSLFFLAIYLSAPGNIFTYEATGRSSLIVLFIVIPAIVIMVSLLKKRLNQKTIELNEQLNEALKAEEELKLLAELSTNISSSNDIKTALDLTLKKICETTYWHIADAWIYNSETDTMDFITAFHTKHDKKHARFIRSSSGMSFRKGVELPGQAWEKNSMVWIKNFGKEVNDQRAVFARQAGIKSAMGIPVPLKDDVIAVLGFYLDGIWDRDKKFIELVTAVAGQLGALLEKKQSEQALADSELKFRSILETTPESVVLFDENGLIFHVNESARGMFGYNDQEMTGEPVTMLIPEENSQVNVNLKNFMENKIPELLGKVVEVNGLRNSGEIFPAELALGTWEVDKHKFYSAIMRDITERKNIQVELQSLNMELEMRVKKRTEELANANDQLLSEILIRRQTEEALLIKNEELENTNADLDRFTYTASHDLKVPIANMEGLVSNLKELIPASREDEFMMISLIEKSVEQLKSTVLDLIDVIKAQKVEKSEPEIVNIESLIDEIKININHLIEQDKAEIILNANDYPEIRFSKAHLKSIMYNLITNAIKYKHPTRNPLVNISTTKLDGYSVISVKDNGLGLAEEQKDKIFHMFKRVHDHVEGSGIGLYIVKRIVEDKKGKIEVFSKLDEGTEFRIYLNDTV